jgi:quercetin dioxygenase-like cupin family protein
MSSAESHALRQSHSPRQQQRRVLQPWRPAAASSARSDAAPARPAGCPTAWRELFPAVRFRTLATGPDTLITSLRFARGASAPLHRHDCTQAGYVLSGRVRITTPDEQYVVVVGESYVIPSGLPHQIRALAETTVVDTFTRGCAHPHQLSTFSAGMMSVK